VRKLWIFELFMVIYFWVIFGYEIRKSLKLLFKEIKESLAITFDMPMIVTTIEGTLITFEVRKKKFFVFYLTQP